MLDSVDGIRSKRNNAGRIPKISSDKNKDRIKEIISKSPTTFGYLKDFDISQLMVAGL